MATKEVFMGRSTLPFTFALELLECFLDGESLLNQPGEAVAPVEFLVTDTRTGSFAVLTSPRLGTCGGEAERRLRCLLSGPSASPGRRWRPPLRYLKGASVQTVHSLCKISYG